jgi:hypothetical protein
MIPKLCSQCGRRALVLVSKGGRRNRQARKGRPVVLKDHDLCQACYRSLRDRLGVRG